MAYLKPQKAMKDIHSGDFFYPITTIDQVLFSDGITRINDNTFIKKSGDTMTGNLTAPTFIGSLRGTATNALGLKNNSGHLTTQEEIDYFIVADLLQYATFQTPTQNNIGMAANDGMILSIPWKSTVYGSQIAFDDSTTPLVKVRGKSGNWGEWKTVAFTDGTIQNANLLNWKNKPSTATTSFSTWRNGVTDGEVVWGQNWRDTSLSTDTGDLTLWLKKDGNMSTINMTLDGSITACQGFIGNLSGSADMLDGYHEGSFFRYRGNIPTAYADSTVYTAGDSNYRSYENGIYNIPRSGYSELLIHFQGSGSASGLEIKTNYGMTNDIFVRKTIDSNRISGNWIKLFTTANFLNYIYPVGAVYLSVSPTSPATLFGGSWTRIAGGYMYLTGGTDGGASGGSWSTGGTAISSSQMPSHYHISGSNANAHVFSWYMGGSAGIRNPVWASAVANSGWPTDTSKNYLITDQGNWNSTSYAGGNQAHSHSITPPYYNVYAWRRTA